MEIIEKIMVTTTISIIIPFSLTKITKILATIVLIMTLFMMQNIKTFYNYYIIYQKNYIIWLKKRGGSSLSCFGNLLYFNDFLFPKVFWVFNFGHFFCPFFENPKKSWRKTNFVTIIEIYRVVTKKIIFSLLA
jgi:hypothetical protein